MMKYKIKVSFSYIRQTSKNSKNDEFLNDGSVVLLKLRSFLVLNVIYGCFTSFYSKGEKPIVPDYVYLNCLLQRTLVLFSIVSPSSFTVPFSLITVYIHPQLIYTMLPFKWRWPLLCYWKVLQNNHLIISWTVYNPWN